MPNMQLEVRSDRRQMAEALATTVAVMPNERQAGSAKEGRVTRLCELAWEAAAVLAFCTGAFWIVRGILVVAN